jgi:hypothetical protein
LLCFPIQDIGNCLVTTHCQVQCRNCLPPQCQANP